MLRLSRISVDTLTVGHIINILSNDARKFDKAFYQFHFMWIGPITLPIVTILTWRMVGWPALLASGYILLLIPSSLLLGRLVGKVFLKITRLTDQRVRLTGEAVSGVRAIKMYAWELPVAKMIKLIRRYDLPIWTNIVWNINYLLDALSEWF